MDKQVITLTVDEINYQVKQLKPIEQVEIISNILMLLDGKGEEIIDDEDDYCYLLDVLYDSIKDRFIYVRGDREC